MPELPLAAYGKFKRIIMQRFAAISRVARGLITPGEFASGKTRKQVLAGQSGISAHWIIFLGNVAEVNHSYVSRTIETARCDKRYEIATCALLPAVQHRQTFHVKTMGEQIKRANRPQPVSPLCKSGKVPRQRGGVAGNIKNRLRPQRRQISIDAFGARARGVENDFVEFFPPARQIAHSGGHRGGPPANILNAVQLSVQPSVVYSGAVAVDGDKFISALGDGQGEITRSAIKLQYSVASVKLAAFKKVLQNYPVSLRIDLGENIRFHGETDAGLGVDADA